MWGADALGHSQSSSLALAMHLCAKTPRPIRWWQWKQNPGSDVGGLQGFHWSVQTHPRGAPARRLSLVGKVIECFGLLLARAMEITAIVFEPAPLDFGWLDGRGFIQIVLRAA